MVVVVGCWLLVVGCGWLLFCYTKHSQKCLEERMPLVAERLLLDRLVTLDNLPSDSSESKPLPLHVEMIDVHKVGPLQPLPSNSGK